MQHQPDTHASVIPPPSYAEAMGQAEGTSDNKYVSPTGHELYAQYQQTLNMPSIIGYQPQNNFYPVPGTAGPYNLGYVPNVSAETNPTSSAQRILPAQGVVHRNRSGCGKCTGTCPATILTIVILLILIKCLMITTF